MNIPPLPQRISNDGSEVWDWAAKMAEVVQRNQKIRDIRQWQREFTNVCGACTKWMTNNCPRETHVNGRRRGPSMAAPKCGKFVETDRRAKDREEKETELQNLLS